MKFLETSLPGVILCELDSFRDQRGYFIEVYSELRYSENGIKAKFVQDNFSCSKKGVLRGLHYQINKEQDKLVSCIAGAILDVAVDIREDSPTFGKWVAEELTSENNRQLFVPKGFAHGFYVLSDDAYVTYKCSDFYSPEDDRGVLWSDPEIGIDWPNFNPDLSEKDSKHLPLSKIESSSLPKY